MQVHRDIMDGRYSMPPFNGEPGVAWVAPTARVDPGARLEGPLFVDEGCVVKAGRAARALHRARARTARSKRTRNMSGAIVWPDSRIGREARRDATRSSADPDRSAGTPH